MNSFLVFLSVASVRPMSLLAGADIVTPLTDSFIHSFVGWLTD